jgi:hypothetical protein
MLNIVLVEPEIPQNCGNIAPAPPPGAACTWWSPWASMSATGP